MNVLVLGSTGFIGKSLINRLKNDPNPVTGVSRSGGLNLLDYQQTKQCISSVQPDVIYNVASHGGSLHYVKEFAASVYSDNLQMGLNLYRALDEIGSTAKVVQPFSNCSYPGNSSVQNEENWLNGAVHPSIFSFGNSKSTNQCS